MFRALVMEDFLSRAGDGVFVRSTTDVKNNRAVTLQTSW
jgi:hypothetical protein